MTEKIAVLCDMHLRNDADSPQYAYLLRAAERMSADGIKRVIVCGDMTAYGDVSAYSMYRKALEGFEIFEVLGNSDVRSEDTADELGAKIKRCELCVGSRKVLGINTPYSVIDFEDRCAIEKLSDGDMLFLHNYVDSLKDESREYLNGILAKKALTVLHGHGHRIFDYNIGISHVLGFRGLDPDKAIGAPPSINYLTVSDEKITCEEIFFPASKETLADIKRFLGISCVDLLEDMEYAEAHNVPIAELRCDHAPWPPKPEVLQTVKRWREKTGGFLSVHMPNLKYSDGRIVDVEKWYSVLDYALLVGADHLTVHPPRIKRSELFGNADVMNELIGLHAAAAMRVADNVTVGIENLHRDDDEPYGDEQGFACTPEEVIFWIDKVNERIGKPDRVGHVLDVGHARNNGKLAKLYPVSRWYAMTGDRAVAYHVHQSVKKEKKLKNHRPLENWSGPMINYTGFFYAWERGILNRAPVILEVKGWKNHEISMEGFEKILSECE